MNYDEIKSVLSVASRRRQQFGASEKQIGFLASLIFKHEVNHAHALSGLNTLTKFEASMMINHILQKKEISSTLQPIS